MIEPVEIPTEPGPVLVALAEQHAELAGLLEALDDEQWARPSRCAGWTVSDVVVHLAQTDELALASLDGRLSEPAAEAGPASGSAGSVDDLAERMVARDRGTSGRAVAQRWHASASALRQAFASCDPHRRVVWVAGELSARTLAATRVAETWVHTGDVAFALGRDLRPTDRLWHIARLAWRTLPYAFDRAGRRMTGPVAFELLGPGGEAWSFVPDSSPATTIRGDALELCLVAGRRLDARHALLEGEGPDAGAVLELVRTYA